MKHRTGQTVGGRVMTLAVNPQGILAVDVAAALGCRSADIAKCMRNLEAQGYITRKVDAKTRKVTAFATREQHKKFFDRDKEAIARKAEKERRLAEAKRRMQRHVNVTFSQPKPRQVSAFDRNAPAIYPVDEHGNPLWKFTACPGFTGDPIKTNTHTGAY